jgi:glycerol-3-phosphate O-acyltransferase
MEPTPPGHRPADGTRAVVFLAQVASAVEREIIEKWLVDHRGDYGDATTEVIVVDFPRRDTITIPPALGQRLSRGDDPLLAPLRVAWLPKIRNGKRQVYLRDLLIIGNPRKPRLYAKHLIAKHHPDRLQVLVGEPATSAVLRAIWSETNSEEHRRDSDFARFVVRRATLALERAASQLLGPQYKMPRLVREEIRTSSRFRQGLARLAEAEGIPMAKANTLAETALKELASGFTPLGIDLNLIMGRFLYKQGYEEQLDYDMAQVEKVRAALANTPGIVLPSHRSNMDVGVMSVALHDLGLPRTNTLGGMNMSFWPLGYIMRRSGVIFIRRDIKSDPVYRWVLKEYLGYVVEKRFSLQWYIEGTRSRTGKSLPPKLGLLKYVVDAYREGRCENIALIPASTTYDQLNEVKEYAGEAMGQVKKAENLGWFFKFFRSVKGRFGQIHVRFGDPVLLSDHLGTPQEAAALSNEEYHLTLQKMAFEVSWRINKVAPVTAVSLITMTALSAYNQALTFAQLRKALNDFVHFTQRHAVPTTKSARQLLTAEGVRAELRALIHQGVIHAEEDGPEPVYTIHRDQHVAASFYRNSIVHHFLDAAIAEVALVAACKGDCDTPLETFWATAFQLRDVLKFDFFFLEKNQFRESVTAYLDSVDPDWQQALTGDNDCLQALGNNIKPLTADSVLRCFLESYWIVGICLQLKPELLIKERKAFLKFCTGTARQYLLQQRITHPEASSLHLFNTGLQLAENRGALDIKADSYKADVDSFVAEIRGLLDLIEDVSLIGRQVFNNRIFKENSTHDSP